MTAASFKCLSVLLHSQTIPGTTVKVVVTNPVKLKYQADLMIKYIHSANEVTE